MLEGYRANLFGMYSSWWEWRWWGRHDTVKLEEKLNLERFHIKYHYIRSALLKTAWKTYVKSVHHTQHMTSQFI